MSEVVSLHTCVLPCKYRKILEMLPKLTKLCEIMGSRATLTHGGASVVRTSAPSAPRHDQASTSARTPVDLQAKRFKEHGLAELTMEERVGVLEVTSTKQVNFRMRSSHLLVWHGRWLERILKLTCCRYFFCISFSLSLSIFLFCPFFSLSLCCVSV